MKNTKSYAGDRFIPLSDFVLVQISLENEMVVNYPNNITDRFEWILKRSGRLIFVFMICSIIAPLYSIQWGFLMPTLCSAAAGEVMQYLKTCTDMR